MKEDIYVIPTVGDRWEVTAAGASRFSWEYESGRDRLLALYQKGKDKQWDSVKRIDWSLEVDPCDVLGVPDQSLALYGSKYWTAMSRRQQRELHLHNAAWQFSQFLHGEQGAMVCAARIVESVPDLDAKFYSATQVMDEARHVELFSRFLHDKIGMLYPINSNLQALLHDTLSDSRWDMPYLGMQVLIEGLALATFGVLRNATTKPLPKQLLAYVMQDEARHVAFGRIALRDYYRELSEAERREREDYAGVPESAVQPHRPVRPGHRALERARSAGLPAAGGARPGPVGPGAAHGPGRGFRRAARRAAIRRGRGRAPG